MESFNKNWLVILLVAIVFGLLGYLLGKTSQNMHPFPHFDKHKMMMFSDKGALHDDISVVVDVEKIIDGDTLWSQIDCGFETLTRQKLRLRAIDCPEIKTQAGQKAKRFVEDQLKDCEFTIVKTHKSDKYDRYLADIFFLPNEPDASVVAREGRFLSQELLDNGLAQIWKA